MRVGFFHVNEDGFQILGVIDFIIEIGLLREDGVVVVLVRDVCDDECARGDAGVRLQHRFEHVIEVEFRLLLRVELLAEDVFADVEHVLREGFEFLFHCAEEQRVFRCGVLAVLVDDFRAHDRLVECETTHSKMLDFALGNRVLFRNGFVDVLE